MKKKEEQFWVDEYGFSITREELIEEIKLTRLINRNLHELLTKHKISVLDIANAENQAKKKFYNDETLLKETLKIEEKKKRKYTKKADKFFKKI